MSRLMKALIAQGLTDYGSIIPRELVREALELVAPDMGTEAEYRALVLEELTAVAPVRDELMEEGKYLKGTPSGYRILGVTENKEQVRAYDEAATRKTRRADLLNKNTPAQYRNSERDTTATTAARRQHSADTRAAHHARLA